MTAPVSPAKFAHPDDVKARYLEGDIPAEKLTTSPAGWVQLRIEDVEADLIGCVPSLADPVDSTRARRVKTLVADKVLELYRNPERFTQTTSTMDGFSETGNFGGRGEYRAAISFTEEELDKVRLPIKKRSRFGTIPVGPGPYRPSRSCW